MPRSVTKAFDSNRLCVFSLAAFAALAAWLPANSSAQSISEKIDKNTYAWVAGETEFQNHCAACHGEDGKGHGPVADLFKTSLPDLTQLSAKNRGFFPYIHVYHTIDGRNVERAHGTIKMPVWGERYTEDRKDEVGQRMAHARIFELIVYLQSLQEKAPGSSAE